MKKQGRASRASLVRALENLTGEDHRRLALIAARLLRKEGYLNHGLEVPELVNIAVLALLTENKRGWFYKKRSVYKEVARIMFSQANHRHEHYYKVTRKQGVHLQHVDERHDDPLGGTTELHSLRSTDPVAAAEMDGLLTQLERVVSADDEAQAVALERLRGLTGPEIQQKLDLTRQQYDTIVRRINDHARKSDVAKDL